MTAHLGSRVSALVDGQLNDAARERWLAHLAWCDTCSVEVAAARRTRQLLTHELVEVAPTPDFLARLLALAPVDLESLPTVPVPVTVAGRAARLGATEQLPPRWQALSGAVAVPRRWIRGAVGTLVGVAAVGAGLFALGDQPAVAPDLQSDVALSALLSTGYGNAASVLDDSSGSAAPSGGWVDRDYLDWMQAAGWPCPDSLPTGFSVMSVRFVASDVLEVDLLTPRGPVVLREQKGRLDEELLPVLDRVSALDAPVYQFSDDLVHLVWQSSDTVVDLVACGSVDDVLQLVSTFSVDTFDTGFQARVGRGWTTLTGVLT